MVDIEHQPRISGLGQPDPKIGQGERFRDPEQTGNLLKNSYLASKIGFLQGSWQHKRRFSLFPKQAKIAVVKGVADFVVYSSSLRESERVKISNTPRISSKGRGPDAGRWKG